MKGVRTALIAMAMILPGVMCAMPGPGDSAPEGLKTAFAVLVGFPSADRAPGNDTFLVPGTVIPLTDESASSGDRDRRPIVERSLSFSRAAEKLWSTFRLDPARRTQLGKTESVLPGKPLELPTIAEANIRMTATLLKYDNTNATFRVVFRQGEKVLADSTPTVARGGRAVVGGMDGTAAPYFFVFIEPEAAAESQGKKSSSLPPDVTEPNPVSKVPPVYPVGAKEDKVQGTVILDVVIDERGNVVEASALQDPDARLTQAAIEAVRQWKFQPALDGAGKPIKVHASITFNFKLK